MCPQCEYKEKLKNCKVGPNPPRTDDLTRISSQRDLVETDPREYLDADKAEIRKGQEKPSTQWAHLAQKRPGLPEVIDNGDRFISLGDHP